MAAKRTQSHRAAIAAASQIQAWPLRMLRIGWIKASDAMTEHGHLILLMSLFGFKVRTKGHADPCSPCCLVLPCPKGMNKDNVLLHHWQFLDWWYTSAEPEIER